MTVSKQLASTLLVCAAAVGSSQIRFVPSHAKKANFDREWVKKDQAAWELTVDRHRTGVVMLGYGFLADEPQIAAQYQGGGCRLFTIDRGESDPGFTPYWSTFMYKRGRVVFLSKDYRAAGVNRRGSYLLAAPGNSSVPPDASPYDTAQVMKVVISGRTFDLGVVAYASISDDDLVRGYYWADPKGRRGYGPTSTEAPKKFWHKVSFVWRAGKMATKQTG
jgi:hypothetical protein